MADIAAAMERVKTVLSRRPDMGLHDDATATARWDGGTRIVASHANGARVATDMPVEMGGTGDQVSPGWLFRAGMASCAATTIAMKAAEAGIELTALEVKALSRSDTRGFLGLRETSGKEVSASPIDIRLHVTLTAPGVSTERLRTLVEDCRKFAPICGAVANTNTVELTVEVAG